jgi:hypothetical protein
MCGAKTRNGGTCKNWGMLNGRCRMHGGTALNGIANPAWKTGRYSKYVPKAMLSRYELALADVRLLELRDEIALIDSRIQEAVSALSTNESGAAWVKLAECSLEMTKAQQSGDMVRLAVVLTDVQHVISMGAGDYQQWKEIREFIADRQRLVESERKRLVDLQQMMTQERVLALIGMVISSVKRNVVDANSLRAISEDIGRALSGDVTEGVVASRG